MNKDIPTPTRELRPAPPRLLIVDEDDELRDTLAKRFTWAGVLVTTAESGEEALAKINRAGFDLALFDLHMPGMSGLDLLEKFKKTQPDAEVLLLTAHGSIGTAIEAMRRGAYDYFTKPFQLADLEVHLQEAYRKVRLAQRQRQWQEQVRFESPRYRLVGAGPAMNRVMAIIERASATDATVLVCGPSGSGKEVVASALHINSARSDRPLVTINCAALTESRLESELFGHEKGAFTGAVQAKPGLVEVAEGGTLFIDAIAEMAPGLQAKLLRVLEDGHFRRVGGTGELQADVRVIAATNRPLEEEQQAGRFREDLYCRLNVIAIALPPLRERREDLPELVEHFLTTRSIDGRRCRITPEGMEALNRYDWPGNVRELANVLERAQILAENHVITADDLPEHLVEAARTPGAPSNPRRWRDVERRYVQQVLRQEKGNKVQAAKSLGISRRALYRLIVKYHLETPH